MNILHFTNKDRGVFEFNSCRITGFSMQKRYYINGYVLFINEQLLQNLIKLRVEKKLKRTFVFTLNILLERLFRNLFKTNISAAVTKLFSTPLYTCVKCRSVQHYTMQYELFKLFPLVKTRFVKLY